MSEHAVQHVPLETAPVIMPPPEGRLESVHDTLSAEFPTAGNLRYVAPDVHTSDSDLQRLLNDDAFFDTFFNTTQQATALYNEHDKNLAACMNSAIAVLQTKPQLEQIRASAVASLERANALRKGWPAVLDKQAESAKIFSFNYQKSRLADVTATQDSLSKELAESFTNGHLQVGEFVEQYLQMRALYRKRMFYLERFQQGMTKWR